MKTIVVMGDEQRLVVKNLIRDLMEENLKVSVVPPEVNRVESFPDVPIHLILCLSDFIDFSLVLALAKKSKTQRIWFYFVGKISGLSLDEGSYLKKIPGFHFSSLPLDLNILKESMEFNERERKRIMVIDDEPIMLRTINNWLGNDYELLLAKSGEAGIDMLYKQKVDLILLDYKMPTMEGPDVMQALRSNEKTERIPIIFLTGKNDRGTVLNAVRLKPDGYILKSLSPQEIKASVADFFKNRVAFY
ncbi:MAG TPA: hypothetical protein DEO40_02880 [Treponema sp.]|jgi:CheY-like chemotaxis protein|nr:response regulator [Treponema sp.]HAK68946.1 hypothetical protein [Treponema sp.]HCA19603.1 hypothetical protein [Treponema sp.]